MPAPKISALAAVVVTVPLLADGAGAGGGGADVERVDRIQAAVFQGADVDVGGGGVEGDGDGVGGGGGGFDVGGVVDGLADAGAAGGGHGQLVGVAGRVGDRGDVGGGVVPADGQDVGVPGGLGVGVGHRDRGLIGLRHRRIHLHKSRRSTTALATAAALTSAANCTVGACRQESADQLGP